MTDEEFEKYKETQDYKISKWLEEYESILSIAKKEKIHSERLSKTFENLALQRTGFEPLPLKYITSKGWYRQYQYLLLLQNESEIDEQRLLNLGWLDDLSDWLENKNKNKEFPILGNNKIIKSITCANSMTYQESEDGAESIYALQIYVNVRKEK